MKDSLQETGFVNARRFFVLLGIALVLLGLIFMYAAPIQWDKAFPAPLWLCIAGLIVFLWGNFYRPGRLVQAFFARAPFSGTAHGVVVAFMLSLLATVAMVAFERDNRINYIPVITFWAAGGLFYLAAFGRNLMSAVKWQDWFKRHWRELIWIGLLTVLAAALRFYKLGIAPYVLNGDEGRMGIMAQATNSGYLANPFALWENFGALYLQAIDLSLKLFGATPFALRLVPAIGGILAVPALYLLARYIAGQRIALISAALLAFSHTHMHFSRTAAVGYIQSTWLVPLELYFLLSGIEKRSSWRAALGGILLGIHFSIYLTSQIITALVLVFLVIAFIVFRSWLKAGLRQVAVFWGGLLLMLIPELVYIYRHPEMFVERLSRDGTLQTGWLAQTIANTGKSAFEVLFERVLHAFLSLVYYPSIDFYGSSIPMFSVISAMFFLIGLMLVLWRKHTPGSLMLNGYFWAVTLSIGLFSIPPSADTYRMLIALPPAIVMAAVGLDRVLELLGLGWEQARSSYAAVASLTLISLLLFNLWTYYDDFIGHCLYGENLEGRFASHLGSYARNIDQDAAVYLLSDGIFFAGSHASVDFLSRGKKITNVPEPADSLDLIPGEVVIASPNRIAELETWIRTHSGGDLDYIYDCKTPILLAYKYSEE